MIVLPDAENRTIMSSFVWTKHRIVRTDRRTYSPWLLQRAMRTAMRTAVRITYILSRTFSSYLAPFLSYCILLSNCRCRQGYLFLTHLFGVNPKLEITKFDVNKPETSLYRTLWNVFRYLEPFRCRSRVWRTDGRPHCHTHKMGFRNSALWHRRAQKKSTSAYLIVRSYCCPLRLCSLENKISAHRSDVVDHRQTRRCRVERSSICVCWDTSTECCLLCTILPLPSPCQQTSPFLQQTTSELWCLSGCKREEYQNCSVLYCVLKLCTVISTLRWAVLTVLWIAFCHIGPTSLYVDWFICVCLCVFCVFLFHTA